MSSGAWPWTPLAPPTPATRARPWPSLPWPMCCSPASCVTTRLDPEWPDRDRFVLSNGHASILLYSMLYLTGYGLDARRPALLPPVGKPDAGPPRAQPHPRGRSDHRSARPGSGQRRRHGHRRAVAARHVLARGLRPPHLRGRRRRVLRGGHLPRGRLAGRAPPAGPAGLRLRQQPHHHRRSDRARLLRRRAPAFHRLWLGGGGHRRSGQRPRRPRGGAGAGPGR